MTPTRPLILLVLAATAVAGCGGTTHGHAARATAPSPPAAPAPSAGHGLTDAVVRGVALGTPPAAVAERFGAPLRVQHQAVAGGHGMECLVYRADGRATFALFCFVGGELASASTIAGEGVLTAPASGEGPAKALKAATGATKPLPVAR